jgi:heavy metal translocating P-type ATPase
LGLIRKFREDESIRIICLTVMSGVFLIASIFGWVRQLPFDPAWAAILISGIPIVYGAAKGLITEFDVTADVLVAIALVAAVAIGEYFAAGEVAFIMQLGKVLEDVTAGKTKKSLHALMKLSPQKACIKMADGETTILASDVKPGNIILVRPGEAIPMDGRIISGSTSIDQSIMTGESVPVDKTIGDPVYQGTVNQQGAIEIEATQAGNDTSLQNMIRLVAQAEENKAPIVRLADKWARILVPVALGCALVIYLITKDVYRAVTALVVFCPCSLILATPAAMMAAIGNATKKGILIKSGAAVEAASKMDTLVTDKTGTLTYGQLQVKDVIALDGSMQSGSLLGLVASAEKFSEHPVGKAVRSYSHAKGIAVNDPEHFEMQAGKGIAARVDGHDILIGEKIIGPEILQKVPEALALMEKMQKEGKTVLPVAMEGRLIGLVSLADTLRTEAKGTIEALRQNGILNVIMLTGDNREVADAIGSYAGVTQIYASQLPEDKVRFIKALTGKGNIVGMVGDGINDAPSLASASVGIVMGAIGSGVTMEAADVALLGDDLSKLPFFLRICRKTKKRIVSNIILSMLLNFSAIILAGFGLLTPVTAAIVHNLGSVFVVVSSALLLTYKE